MAEKRSEGKQDAKTSRCWPGYEPVPGKSEHQEGSCRKKPASRNGGKEPDRETSRKKQVAQGGKRAEQAKSKSSSASERKSVSKTSKKSTAHKTAAKKSTAKKTATKSGSSRKAASKSGSSKKTATAKS